MSKQAKIKKIPVAAAAPLVKYNFGVGNTKEPGYVGVDIVKTDQTDVVANLFKFPYSFAQDNSAEEIFTSHFIEHLPMAYVSPSGKVSLIPEDGESMDMLDKFFEECWRILAPGGKLVIVVPYYNSMRAWQDPSHRRAISEATFLYANKEWRIQNGLDHCHSKANFNYGFGYAWDQTLLTRDDNYRGFAAKFYTNSITDLYATLTKIE